MRDWDRDKVVAKGLGQLRLTTVKSEKLIYKRLIDKSLFSQQQWGVRQLFAMDYTTTVQMDGMHFTNTYLAKSDLKCG